jgi:O-antigen ligase
VGTWYFNQYVDPETGEMATVTIDGFWTLQLSTRGLVGLCSWLALSLLPILVFLRRNPLAAWRTPVVATGGALAVVLLLHTADCIPNPNVDPMFTLIAGGLIGVPALAGLRAAQRAPRAQRARQRLLENMPRSRGESSM